MSARETETIIAALRFWQLRHLPPTPEDTRRLDMAACRAGPSLDHEEIDALCNRLRSEVTQTPEDKRAG